MRELPDLGSGLAHALAAEAIAKPMPRVVAGNEQNRCREGTGWNSERRPPAHRRSIAGCVRQSTGSGRFPMACEGRREASGVDGSAV